MGFNSAFKGLKIIKSLFYNTVPIILDNFIHFISLLSRHGATAPPPQWGNTSLLSGL
jgi:hypothetical protein